jgi:hypothetical protein
MHWVVLFLISMAVGVPLVFLQTVLLIAVTERKSPAHVVRVIMGKKADRA